MRKFSAARTTGRHRTQSAASALPVPNKSTWLQVSTLSYLALAAGMAFWLAHPGAAHAQSLDPLLTPPAAGAPRTAATTPTKLTLDQAITMAMQRHPDLASAQHEVEATQGAVEQAGLLPNPELAVSMEDTRRATRTTAVQLSQRLELGGKRGARRKAAELAQGVAQAQLEARRAQVRAAVQTAFWDVLTAQGRVELARESSTLANQVFDAASKRVAAGKVSPVESTRARLALTGVNVEAQQAEQELTAARARLSAVIGQPLSPAQSFEVPISTMFAVPQDSELATRLDQAPDVIQAQSEVQRREAVVDLERARQAPDLTLGVGTQRNNELGRNQPLLSMSLPLPLFDRNQGNLREAIARADQARDELNGVRVRLLADVQVVGSQLRSARQQVLMVEQQMLPDAQQAYEAATTGFSLGKFSFLDVLDAQRTLFQVRSQHLKVLSEVQRAATELDRLLGFVPAASAQQAPNTSTPDAAGAAASTH
jgi:cobalt-zinc-cadmium efflux system outer membrane protein